MNDQMSFADAMLGPGIGSNDKLARIDALIDWRPLSEIVAGLSDDPVKVASESVGAKIATALEANLAEPSNRIVEISPKR